MDRVDRTDPVMARCGWTKIRMGVGRCHRVCIGYEVRPVVGSIGRDLNLVAGNRTAPVA